MVLAQLAPRLADNVRVDNIMYVLTSFAVAESVSRAKPLALTLSERRGRVFYAGWGHFAYEEGEHVGMSLAEM